VPGTVRGEGAPDRFRARDLVSVPGLLTLARLPLAACFPFAVSRPPAAFAVLSAAACTDMLDGWWARRFGQVTVTGGALDPLADKVFAISVGVSLFAARVLPMEGVLLLGAREIGELLLVVRCALGPPSRRDHAARLSANGQGKVVTVLQFAAVCSALAASPFTDGCVAVAAVAGAFSALTYWRRAFLPASASLVPAGRGGCIPAERIGRPSLAPTRARELPEQVGNLNHRK
jgi:cardiolipin synthase